MVNTYSLKPCAGNYEQSLNPLYFLRPQNLQTPLVTVINDESKQLETEVAENRHMSDQPSIKKGKNCRIVYCPAITIIYMYNFLFLSCS